MDTQHRIEFSVDDAEYATEMDEESRDYISMTADALENDLKRLLDADDVVVNAPSVDVVFSYPFASEHIITLRSKRNNFTRRALARAIAGQYQQMYREEDDSSSEIAESHAARCERLGLSGPGCQLLNRVATSGKWRIWGHDLGDLSLHAAVFDPTKNAYRLEISS